MLVSWHVSCFAMEFAIYVVVAAVWAGRVSGCVGVPAASVGGGGGGDGAGAGDAARCGLSRGGGEGGARCGLGWSGGGARCGWCGV